MRILIENIILLLYSIPKLRPKKSQHRTGEIVLKLLIFSILIDYPLRKRIDINKVSEQIKLNCCNRIIDLFKYVDNEDEINELYMIFRKTICKKRFFKKKNWNRQIEDRKDIYLNKLHKSLVGI